MDEHEASALQLMRSHGICGDIWSSKQESRRAEMTGGVVNATAFTQRHVWVLRVWEESRVGQVSTANPERFPEVLELAQVAARYGGRTVAPEHSHRRTFQRVQTYDPGVAELSLADIVTALQSTYCSAQQTVGDALTLKADVTQSVRAFSYANSEGLSEAFTQTVYTTNLWGSAVEAGDALKFWNYMHTGRLHSPEEVVVPLVNNWRHSRRSAHLPDGVYRALISPRVVVSLLQPLQRQVNGRIEESALESMVLSRAVTLWDRPLADFAIGSCPFDDEGSPTGDKLLFHEGRQTGLLQSLVTACARGGSQAGNGFRFVPHLLDRDYSVQPQPWMSNLCLESGVRPMADLIADIQEGIWIEQVASQGSNRGVVSGHVSIGWVIRNGEITGRLRNTAVAIDAVAAFQSDSLEMSAESVWTGGGKFSLPYLLVDQVNLRNMT